MKEELKKRTKTFAIEVFKNTQKLDRSFIDYKRQIIRCSSSVGANYRAACRAKSTKDFINKLKIVEEELDESLFFIELIGELTENNGNWLKLHEEGETLLRIFVKSIITSRKKLNFS